MIAKKIYKILALSLSLSVASMGFAFAESNVKMDEPLTIQITAVDEALYAKQGEIDKKLFEEFAEDLKAKGIMVTNTGAVEDYIEIGIAPYTPENADYVSKLVNEEGIKVVEGIEAVILQYNPELNEGVDHGTIDPAELADDSQIVEVTGEVAEAEDISTTNAVEDVKTISAPVEQEKGVSPFVIGAGIVAVLGIGAAILKKKTA